MPDEPARSARSDVDPDSDPLDAWPTRPPPPPDVRDRLTAFATRYGLSWARVVVGVLAVVAVSVGGWWLLRPPPPPIEQTLPVAAAEPSAPATSTAAGATSAEGARTAIAATTTTAPPADLVVHAAGAVSRPGVYRLPATARVDDLVRAAGGLAPSADVNRVNLAAPVSDGERVYVPAAGEDDPPPPVASSPAATPPAGTTGGTGTASTPPDAGAPGGDTSSAPVDLNHADATALDTLPGVGPATAQAIITYRDEHGPFRSVDELLEVRGIGDAKLAELRDRVTVGG